MTYNPNIARPMFKAQEIRIRTYEDLAKLESQGKLILGTIHFKGQTKQPCIECGGEFNRLNVLSYVHSAGICNACQELYHLNYRMA